MGLERGGGGGGGGGKPATGSFCLFTGKIPPRGGGVFRTKLETKTLVLPYSSILYKTHSKLVFLEENLLLIGLLFTF
jgi:hypothetical protein